MGTSLRQCVICGLGSMFCVLLSGLLPAQEPVPGNRGTIIDPLQAERGKVLFERAWVENDGMTPLGDGVGPMRNANSCVACHSQGGVGGGGTVHRNVQLLTVQVSKEDVAADGQGGVTLLTRLTRAHSNFQTPQGLIQRTVMLHRLGGEPGYDLWRDTFWGVPRSLTGSARAKAVLSAHEKLMIQPVKKLEGIPGLTFMLSERNTPALFGAEEIDRIPGTAIEAIADDQKFQRGVISGRATRFAKPRQRSIPIEKLLQDGAPKDKLATVASDVSDIGRFGWRAQTVRLRDFVLGACAVELGLSTAGHPQTGNPMAPSEAPVKGIDLSNDQCDQLIEYVRALPRPRQIMPGNSVQAEFVKGGEQNFVGLNCTGCHVAKVGDVDGLYSDLLLHDMGEYLKDPMPAGDGRPVATAGYYGATDLVIAVNPEFLREWRTPPLWGVADSAPYLHDGRAATLDQAILLHGGEAEASVKRYRAMTDHQRQQLLAFLGTLRAPQASPLVAQTRSRPVSQPTRSFQRPQNMDSQFRPRPVSLTRAGR